MSADEEIREIRKMVERSGRFGDLNERLAVLTVAVDMLLSLTARHYHVAADGNHTRTLETR